jgi:hypothetical protein
MLPGPPERLTCPLCGGHKYISSLASGNTFGATVWSDTKKDYPMLPTPSPVQRCPHCGGYFFYDDAKRAIANHDVPAKKEEHSLWQVADRNGFGVLSFEETDEAFDTLFEDTLPEVKKHELLFLWLFCFNDTFNGRGKDGRAPTAELLAKQKTVLRLLISMFPDNGLFVCELHRELGEFEECLKVARGLSGQDDFAASVLRQIVAHAEAHDRRVFAISFSRDSLFTMWDEEVHLP